MLTVDFAKQAFLALPLEEQKEFSKWLEKQAPGDLPKKKRKTKTDNVPSLEEMRHLVHKKHGFTF